MSEIAKHAIAVEPMQAISDFLDFCEGKRIELAIRRGDRLLPMGANGIQVR